MHGPGLGACLSWTDGLFHLVSSDVKSLAGAYKDVHNHVVTAPTPQGPWSDPVPPPGHGFDLSLFQDDGPDDDGPVHRIFAGTGPPRPHRPADAAVVAGSALSMADDPPWQRRPAGPGSGTGSDRRPPPM
ncbi:hypothetical protein [Streptomyces sp. CB03911]|uniref:hypothetical protein n=1 Tax=Streptomyces sp. CB03911 TaxID=1804758 RepID=UPI0009644A5B|nr:hypothetical protein [Streptomyces sp. CB03911]OKI16442.1 hypothetical protein A6A07_10465 [Streptomyces sp. CB03911]